MFYVCVFFFFFFFQAEDGIRDVAVTGVQTCALPILFPFYFMLITSLKSNAELYNLKSIPFLVQTGVIADHYQYLFQRTERSEEHTSELQSRLHLVCRLLLEKKKKMLPDCRLLLQSFA